MRSEIVWKLWKRMDKVTKQVTGERWETLWNRFNDYIFRTYGRP